MAMLFSAEPQLAGVQQGTMGNRIASQITSPVPLWVVDYIGEYKDVSFPFIRCCHVNHSGHGYTNVYIADVLSALNKAISNPSVNGERKLTDTLPQTPGDHPNTSTRTVTLDGVEYRVYVELFIVAPKIVN